MLRLILGVEECDCRWDIEYFSQAGRSLCGGGQLENMDDARRFLRYVTPGLVFLTETLILVWVMAPEVAHTILAGFKKESSLGLAIATVLASGGVGFVFGNVHHWWHWYGKRSAVDHSQFLASLRTRDILRMLRRDSKNPVSYDLLLDRFHAWAVVTGLWHERLAENGSIVRSAEPRVSSLTDLFHSAGAARVASVTACVFALTILWRGHAFRLEPWAVLRLVAGAGLAGALLLLHRGACQRTGKALQLVVEQVLDDALTKESNGKKAPIDTHVAL